MPVLLVDESRVVPDVPLVPVVPDDPVEAVSVPVPEVPVEPPDPVPVRVVEHAAIVPAAKMANVRFFKVFIGFNVRC